MLKLCCSEILELCCSCSEILELCCSCSEIVELSIRSLRFVCLLCCVPCADRHAGVWHAGAGQTDSAETICGSLQTAGGG